jgi:hypothetical protein
MRLLHAPRQSPRRESVTLRPARRVQGPGVVRWAFVEVRRGRIWIAGYPYHPVEQVRPEKQPAAGALVGGGAGTLVGAALGGPVGALSGGLIGAVLVASGSNPEGR